MTRTLVASVFTLIVIVGWTLACAQDDAPAPPNETKEVYRVMSLAEMFEGDEAAKAKIAKMMFQVERGETRSGLRRSDLDAKDYERALNRLASEGWSLVTVNRSNYWVFKKTQ